MTPLRVSTATTEKSGHRYTMEVGERGLPSEQQIRNAGLKFLSQVLDRPPGAPPLVLPETPRPLRAPPTSSRSMIDLGFSRKRPFNHVWVLGLTCMLAWVMLQTIGARIWVASGQRLGCTHQGPILIDHIQPMSQVLRMQHLVRHTSATLSRTPDPALVYSSELHTDFESLTNELGELYRVASISAQHTAGPMACCVKTFATRYGLRYSAQMIFCVKEAVIRISSWESTLQRTLAAQSQLQHQLNATLHIVTTEMARLHDELSRKVWGWKPGGSLVGQGAENRLGKEKRERALELEETVLSQTLEDFVDFDEILWSQRCFLKRYHETLVQIQDITTYCAQPARPITKNETCTPFLETSIGEWFLGSLTAEFEMFYQRVTPSIWSTIASQSWATS